MTLLSAKSRKTWMFFFLVQRVLVQNNNDLLYQIEATRSITEQYLSIHDAFRNTGSLKQVESNSTLVCKKMASDSPTEHEDICPI